MDDNKGFEYVGNVPVVYKGAAYEEIYQPLYIRRGADRLFYAIETEYGLEAVADGKDGKIRFIKDDRLFHYNAENNRLCALIPDYEF